MLDNLDAVIADVSGDGQYRFNERQLLYALRPIVMSETGPGTEARQLHGDHHRLRERARRNSRHVPRAARHHLSSAPRRDDHARHPDGRGLRAAAWTFNKLVYIEKEGFSEALKDERWGERHDCALISSKGFSTRAARDLVDKLAEHDEPVTVFCVHDADAYGTMIYQTFQEATKARGARKIKIINLGLEPWEALAMGLEVETVEEGERRKAVADYVLERDDAPDDDDLGGMAADPPRRTERDDHAGIHRVARRQDGRRYDKLIPPPDVLDAELARAHRGQGPRRPHRAHPARGRFRGSGRRPPSPRPRSRLPPPWPRVSSGCSSANRREWRDHIAAIVKDLKS